MDFLLRIVDAAVEAGATTVNIPDTVGYALPHDFGGLIGVIVRRVGPEVAVSVHCHNDLGLAVANSIEAVRNGARQVEVAVNGIGERAGNCSMEEVVMALATRADLLGRPTRVNTREIARTPGWCRRSPATPSSSTRRWWARTRSPTSPASTSTG